MRRGDYAARIARSYRQGLIQVLAVVAIVMLLIGQTLINDVSYVENGLNHAVIPRDVLQIVSHHLISTTLPSMVLITVLGMSIVGLLVESKLRGTPIGSDKLLMTTLGIPTLLISISLMGGSDIGTTLIKLLVIMALFMVHSVALLTRLFVAERLMAYVETGKNERKLMGVHDVL